MSADDPELWDLSLIPLTGPSDPRDLEVLVMCLELAAIELSPSLFSKEDLFSRAKEYGGSERPLRDDDLALVLPGMKILRRIARNMYHLK